MAALGLGSGLGTWWVNGRGRRIPQPNLLGGGLLVVAVGLAAFAVSSRFAVFAIAGFVVGLAAAPAFVLSETLIQEGTELHQRGRVFSMRDFLMRLLFLIAVTLAGTITRNLGTEPALLLCAVIVAISGLIAIWWGRRDPALMVRPAHKHLGPGRHFRQLDTPQLAKRGAKWRRPDVGGAAAILIERLEDRRPVMREQIALRGRHRERLAAGSPQRRRAARARPPRAPPRRRRRAKPKSTGAAASPGACAPCARAAAWRRAPDARNRSPEPCPGSLCGLRRGLGDALSSMAPSAAPSAGGGATSKERLQPGQRTRAPPGPRRFAGNR